MGFQYGPILGISVKKDQELHLVGCEILRGFATIRDMTVEDSFVFFFTHATASERVDFFKRQVRAAIEVFEKFGCLSWINLHHLMLNDNVFCNSLFDWLTAKSIMRRTRCFPGVGFEIQESGELSDDALKFIVKLRKSGYPIALDDIGVGIYSKPEKVSQMIHAIQPQKIKLDGGRFVIGKDPLVVFDLVTDFLNQISAKIPDLVFEGVPVNPHASRLAPGTFKTDAGRAQFASQPKKPSDHESQWRPMLKEFWNIYRTEVSVQMRSCQLADFEQTFAASEAAA